MLKTKNLSFASKLKALRLQLGKSQEVLAGELGISRSCLANYETGKRQPDEKTLSNIAQLCGVDVSFFFYTAHPLSPLRENDTDSLRETVSESQSRYLDISDLSEAHQICMLEFYNHLIKKHMDGLANQSHKQIMP